MIARASQDHPPEPGATPKLPLVRLRVDYTGFSTINAQRFGQRFVNKVWPARRRNCSSIQLDTIPGHVTTRSPDHLTPCHHTCPRWPTRRTCSSGTRRQSGGGLSKLHDEGWRSSRRLPAPCVPCPLPPHEAHATCYDSEPGVCSAVKCGHWTSSALPPSLPPYRAKVEGQQGDEGDEVLRPEALDQQRIEDLVASNLQVGTGMAPYLDRDGNAALPPHFLHPTCGHDSSEALGGSQIMAHMDAAVLDASSMWLPLTREGGRRQ